MARNPWFLPWEKMRQVNPEDLRKLGIAELRKLWKDLGGPGHLPTIKRLAVREVAWWVQRREQGELEAATRRLLRAAIRGAHVESSRARPRTKKSKARSTRARDLRTGTKLVRKWRGRRHEVTVLDDGKRFEYRGEGYESLTKIAEEITSAHWSGPRFFGLDRVRGMS